MTELTGQLTDRDYQLENANMLCTCKHEELELVHTELFHRLRAAEEQMAEAKRRANAYEEENIALRGQIENEQSGLYCMGDRDHRSVGCTDADRATGEQDILNELKQQLNDRLMEVKAYRNEVNEWRQKYETQNAAFGELKALNAKYRMFIDGVLSDDELKKTTYEQKSFSEESPVTGTTEDDEDDSEYDYTATNAWAKKSRVVGASFTPLHAQSMSVSGATTAVEPHYRPPRGRPSKTVMEKFLALCFQGIKGVEREHWEVIMEKDTLSFVCKLCYRLFNNCYALKQHIRFVHMKVRPFSCEMCTKKFRSMYDLRRHGSTHTQERYACLHCGCDFSSRQRAYAHARETCAGADLASTLSPAYAGVKRRLAGQWDRIQLDNSFGACVNNNGLDVGEELRAGPWRDDTTPQNGGRRRRAAADEPSTSSTFCNATFPAEPIPVDIPDLW